MFIMPACKRDREQTLYDLPTDDDVLLEEENTEDIMGGDEKEEEEREVALAAEVSSRGHNDDGMVTVIIGKDRRRISSASVQLRDVQLRDVTMADVDAFAKKDMRRDAGAVLKVAYSLEASEAWWRDAGGNTDIGIPRGTGGTVVGGVVANMAKSRRDVQEAEAALRRHKILADGNTYRHVLNVAARDVASTSMDVEEVFETCVSVASVVPLDGDLAKGMVAHAYATRQIGRMTANHVIFTTCFDLLKETLSVAVSEGKVDVAVSIVVAHYSLVTPPKNDREYPFWKVLETLSALGTPELRRTAMIAVVDGTASSGTALSMVWRDACYALDDDMVDATFAAILEKFNGRVTSVCMHILEACIMLYEAKTRDAHNLRCITSTRLKAGDMDSVEASLVMQILGRASYTRLPVNKAHAKTVVAWMNDNYKTIRKMESSHVVAQIAQHFKNATGR